MTLEQGKHQRFTILNAFLQVPEHLSVTRPVLVNGSTPSRGGKIKFLQGYIVYTCEQKQNLPTPVGCY